MARPSRQEQERIDAQAARDAVLEETNILEQIKLIQTLGFSNDAATALVTEQLI